jgi:hypothetical protein
VIFRGEDNVAGDVKTDIDRRIWGPRLVDHARNGAQGNKQQFYLLGRNCMFGKALINIDTDLLARQRK